MDLMSPEANQGLVTVSTSPAPLDRESAWLPTSAFGQRALVVRDVTQPYILEPTPSVGHHAPPTMKDHLP